MNQFEHCESVIQKMNQFEQGSGGKTRNREKGGGDLLRTRSLVATGERKWRVWMSSSESLPARRNEMKEELVTWAKSFGREFLAQMSGVLSESRQKHLHTPIINKKTCIYK